MLLCNPKSHMLPLLGIMLFAAQALAAPRLAIIAAKLSPAVQNALALAEAKLSANGAVQLVERQQIQRLLGEQVASLARLADPSIVIKAGKTLSADLLAIIESEANNVDGEGLVIFDASTGVRLWDAALARDQGEKPADAIVAAVNAAMAKRGQAGKTVRTICVLAVRNADMPRSMDGFCDAAGRLLERAMIASPSIALLERSRLEQLNKERAVAPQADRDLLASVIVASIELSRNGASGIRANLALTDSRGRALANLSAAAEKEDAASVVRTLAGELSKSLKSAPAVAAADELAEAARFYREAVLLAEHQDFVRALPAAEAAHALAERNLVYHAMLASSLIDCGHAIFMSQWYSNPTRGEMPNVPKTRPDDILPWVQRRGDDAGRGAAVQAGAAHDSDRSWDAPAALQGDPE